MSSQNNPSQGIDLLNYRWVVRATLDLTPGMRPEKEAFVNTREELDSTINDMVSKGYCVHILPAYIVAENFELYKSGMII